MILSRRAKVGRLGSWDSVYRSLPTFHLGTVDKNVFLPCLASFAHVQRELGQVLHALSKGTGSSLDLHLQLGRLVGPHSWAAPGGDLFFCNAHRAACP